jgi:hypothetical protein
VPSSVTTQSISSAAVSSNSGAVSSGASAETNGASLTTSQATTTGTLSAAAASARIVVPALVDQCAVAEDRVGPDEQDRGPLEPARSLLVLDQLDLEPVLAQILREGAAFVLR